MVSLSVLALVTTAAGTGAAALTASETREEYDFPFLLALALLVAVSFSPRIPLDLGLLGPRRLDIRIEDLVVVVAAVTLVVARSGPNRRLELPWSVRPLLAYLLVATLATVLGIVAVDLSVFRGVFYLLKEFEFVLIAVLVASFVRTRKQVYAFTVVFVGCALLNAGWAWLQILTDSTGPLFQTVRAGGYYGNAISAGTKLVGEGSRLSSGGYYIAPLCLCFGWAAAGRRSGRLRWAAIIVVLLVAIIASLSRASTLSVAAAIVVAGLLVRSVPSWLVLTLPVLGGLAGLALSSVLNVARFRPDRLLNGIAIRINGWLAHFEDATLGVVHGFGKGSLPLVAGVEEAHNQYIRLLIETGPLGLLAFLAFLAAVAASGAGLYYRSRDPVVRAVGLAVLCATASIGLIAFVQDAFANVKLAESYWLLVGLTWSATRLVR